MVVCPDARGIFEIAPDFLGFLAKKVVMDVCTGEDCLV